MHGVSIGILFFVGAIALASGYAVSAADQPIKLGKCRQRPVLWDVWFSLRGDVPGVVVGL